MQTITVDMTPGFRQPAIHYSQNDVGTTFAIDLRSRFGDTLPASPTVKIQATKPSGFGFSIEADSVVDSVATFTTVATMTDEAGRFPAELEVSGSGMVLYTANFYMEGEANPHPIGTTDGSQETIIPTLTLLVERVEAAASSVLDMTVEAETLAAGSQATYSYDEDTNTATFGIPQGEAGAGAAGVTASAYSSSKTYAVGDYVIHNSNLYRCTTAITTAEAFTAAHWTQVVLGDDVSDLKSDLNVVIDDTFEENLDLYNEAQVIIKPVIGRFNASGYDSTKGAYICSQILPAGLYSFDSSFSTDYYYSFWNYISESSGSAIISETYVSNSCFMAYGQCIVCVRKMAGTAITPSEIETIKSKLIIKRTSPFTVKYKDQLSNLTKMVSSVERLEASVFNVSDVLLDYQLGRFDTNGYQFINYFSNAINKLPAGNYELHSSLGANYQYAVFNYVSDSSGTVLVSYNAQAERAFVVTNEAVVCVRKLDQVAFTQADITEVKQKLKLVHLSTPIHKNCDMNKMIDTEVFEYDYATYQTGSGKLSYDVTVDNKPTHFMTNSDGTLVDLRLRLNSNISCIGLAGVVVYCYVPDATNITSVVCEFLNTSCFRSASVKTGWNKLTFKTADGSLSNWSTLSGIRLYAGGNTGLSIYFGTVVLIKPKIGNIILINDGAFNTFYENAYPDMVSIDAPVTWALVPNLIGGARRILQSTLDEIADDPCSEFSFHSWESGETSGMSAIQLQEDASKCLHYLKKNGLEPAHIWRAAHTQNNAPEYMAEVGLVEALATGTALTSTELFPFVDPYNVGRIAIHGRTDNYFDEMFDIIEKTHCTYVLYTHGIESGTYDMDEDSWDYFFGALSTAINDGYVRATTYSRLQTEYLNRIHNEYGDLY